MARDRALRIRWDLAAAALACVSAGIVLLWLAFMAGLLPGATALPPGLDFDAYWSAARLTLSQGAAAAYDNAAIEAYERARTTLQGPGYLAFFYPPVFLLLCLPLALLPYLGALAAFQIGQAALLLPALRGMIVREGAAKLGWLPIVAAPGLLMNLFAGQNAALTAGLIAWAGLLLDTRPLLGGACLGMLAYKPQLAIAAPVALLAARRWRALLATAVTAVVFAAVSWVALGPAAWHGFFANAPTARHDLEAMQAKWRFAQSFYAALRIWGAGLHPAYMAQGILAGVACALLAATAWRRPGGSAEMAMLAAAAPLITPFLYDYDLAVLLPALAWLAARGAASGFLAGERAVLLILYLAPFAARQLAQHADLTIAPPFMLGLLVLLARRARHAA